MVAGKFIILSTNEAFYSKGSQERIYVDYANITKVVKIGENVFVDDGLISLEVVEVGVDFLKTVIRNGGKLGSRKGVNLPTAQVGEFKAKVLMLLGHKN